MVHICVCWEEPIHLQTLSFVKVKVIKPKKTNEPQSGKMYLGTCVHSKGSDEPAHVSCLNSLSCQPEEASIDSQ